LRAGTKFGEPAPLFPRAEKDAADRMQKIEEQNSLSVIEAAGGKAVSPNEPAANPELSAPPNSTAVEKTAPPYSAVEKSKTEGDAGFNPRVKPIEMTGALAPDAKANKKEEIMSEESEKQKFWDNVPVDSVGVQAGDEALAYETVAQAAKEAAAPAAPVAAEPQVAEPQHIIIDDFVKVDLRVAQILVAERVPKADKLLRLEVDLGYEKRQILAGIAQYYEPEKLVGRKIIIVANLAPRKMRGLESNGMLLAASLPPDGAPVLAGFLEDVPLGARLK
jgi:methionyl-tRNA synthetase